MPTAAPQFWPPSLAQRHGPQLGQWGFGSCSWPQRKLKYENQIGLNCFLRIALFLPRLKICWTYTVVESLQNTNKCVGKSHVVHAHKLKKCKVFCTRIGLKQCAKLPFVGCYARNEVWTSCQRPSRILHISLHEFSTWHITWDFDFCHSPYLCFALACLAFAMICTQHMSSMVHCRFLSLCLLHAARSCSLANLSSTSD